MPNWDRENPDDEEPLASHDVHRNRCRLCGMSAAHIEMRPYAPCQPSFIVRITTAPIPRPKRREELASGPYIDVLDQRKWWRSGNGAMSRRRDMNIDHKVNSMASLLRNAGRYIGEYASQPVFGNAPDEVWAELERDQAEPEKWMMARPMFRALLLDVMAFADIGPEDLGLEKIPSAIPGATAWLKRS